MAAAATSAKFTFPEGFECRSSTDKIHLIIDESDWPSDMLDRIPDINQVPDVGMDRYLVTNGKPIGTGGVGCCFAICLIGKTRFQTSVLGLCHSSGAMPIVDVLHILKDSMVKKGADEDTIETYLIGGEMPSKYNEGTLDEEEQIKALAQRENIKGYLFNLAVGEDTGLDVLLTAEKIYVTTSCLFSQLDADAGKNLPIRKAARSAKS